MYYLVIICAVCQGALHDTALLNQPLTLWEMLAIRFEELGPGGILCEIWSDTFPFAF